MKKGQGAVELLIILGVGLAVLLIIFQFSSDSLLSYSSAFAEGQVQDALETLKQDAELVYQQGNGAKTQVYITLPEGIQYTNVTERTLKITFYNGNSLYRNFDFNITGNLSSHSGGQWIDVEAVSGQVSFSPRTT